jgi:phage FluMu protein Com
MSVRDQFGKPRNTSSGGSRTNTFSLKVGENNVFRILPPMKSGAQDGTWAKYYAVHWGYAATNPKDPKKPFFKPFKCIRVKNYDGMIEKDCPQCKHIDQYKTKFDSAVAKLKAKGKSDEEIKSTLFAGFEWLRTFNTDGKWYIPVKNSAGQFGLLKLANTGKKKLEALRRKLIADEGIDLFDIDTGAWVNFTKTSNTDFNVEIVQEYVEENGRKFKATKLAPLSDADLEAAIQTIPDIKTGVVVEITEAQIQSLVDSGADPELVSKVFNQSTRTEAPKAAPVAPKEDVESSPMVDDDLDLSFLGSPTPAPVAAPVSRPVAAPVVREAPVAVSKPAPAPATNFDNMTDDEFFASIGDV